MNEEFKIAKIFSELFINLPPEEIEAIASIIERKEVHKGEILLKEGKVAENIFFVESGMLRQFYYKNGRDVTEHFACARQGVLCIASLFKKENTKLMVEVLESGVIYLIPYFGLIELSGQYPLLATLLRKILESSLILSQEKADSWRYETAHERYSRFLKENPVAARQVSINHLASYLLMSPETLSRVRAGEL
jgi:CRP-like cAMP-binding protein